MNQTLKNIFLFILSAILCGFLMLGSFIFADDSDNIVSNADDDNKWYSTQILQAGSDHATLNQREINRNTQVLKKNVPVIANF